MSRRQLSTRWSPARRRTRLTAELAVSVPLAGTDEVVELKKGESTTGRRRRLKATHLRDRLLRVVAAAAVEVASEDRRVAIDAEEDERAVSASRQVGRGQRRPFTLYGYGRRRTTRAA